MGSSMSSESFRKLQCAYEVLADSVKKRDYDEQLRKEESMAKSVCQKSHSSSRHDNTEYRSEESRRIQCTKCGGGRCVSKKVYQIAKPFRLGVEAQCMGKMGERFGHTWSLGHEVVLAWDYQSWHDIKNIMRIT
ncbi:hypothetical protein KIW84_015095 [Lathyrus oleraceus]|uniref:J domain-containing protein n=1 Tax=Pisum sativum TaxID=3888 RepID=A0A9D5BPD6_PEA|nr:hypothetical protein KIW84_015095 [Pisum sativum]